MFSSMEGATMILQFEIDQNGMPFETARARMAGMMGQTDDATPAVGQEARDTHHPLIVWLVTKPATRRLYERSVPLEERARETLARYRAWRSPLRALLEERPQPPSGSDAALVDIAAQSFGSAFTFCLVCKTWRVVMCFALRTPEAEPFWRACITPAFQGGWAAAASESPLPAPSTTLLDWLTHGDDMAYGTYANWALEHIGHSRAENMTEMELAIDIADIFALWTNLDPYRGARSLAWMRCQVFTWLDGTRLVPTDAAHPFVAYLMDSLIDFQLCPFMDGTVAHAVKESARDLYNSLCCFLDLTEPDDPIHARNWVISTQQTAKFEALVARYAPLFQQKPEAAVLAEEDEELPLVPCRWNSPGMMAKDETADFAKWHFT